MAEDTNEIVTTEAPNNETVITEPAGVGQTPDDGQESGRPGVPPTDKSGKPFSVTVDGGTDAPADLTSITMQPEDPADKARADEARQRVEEGRQLSAQTQAEMARGAEQIGADKPLQPALARIEAEKEAGRRRLAEHAGRQTLLDAKRASGEPEGQRVSNAVESNKDL